MPRKQRRRSWGSITEAGRGKYVLRWVENTPDGRKRKSHTFYGTYKEADAELARIRVRVGDDAPVPTVGQVHRMWWWPAVLAKAEAGKLKPNTVDAYRRAWANDCAPKWGRVPVDSVRPVEVQAWLSSMPLGAARAALAVLRQCVDYAVQYEVVPSNKFRIAYELPAAGASRIADVYDLARARAMLSTVRGSRIEAAYILACFGSCRTGESLAARVDETRFAEVHGVPLALVPIVRRMEHTGRAPVDDLKTEHSRRTVIVPGEYAERLHEIADDCAAFGTPWFADFGDGRPMNVAALGREWKRLAAADYVPFANLRNSWRTFAQAEWRVDYDVLEVLMGHILPGVTGRHYLRMSTDQLADQFAAAYAAFVGR